MAWNPTYVLLGCAVGLLLILVVSFASRPKVFSQYLRALTGIAVSPGEIRRVFRQRGRAGVRELFLELLIREDLREEGVDQPGGRPARPVAVEAGRRR